MADSQHQLSRIRPPRVQITYDVETGGAIEVIELPLVVGIMGDYSRKRDPDNPLPPLKERQFVEIDRDNFNDILKSMVPRALVNTKKLKEGEGESGLDDSTAILTFEQLDDFHPNRLLKNPDTGYLNVLSLERTDLVDLQAKLDGNDELKTALEQTVYPPTDTSVVVPSNDDIVAMMTHNSDDQA
ncbi:MAG TPA: type VI secretion system contractile sheath small subunit, partial [Thioploca sp.]|nr:type VI secretion system contractile sheath small subunit [Thioploca sp.]